eukprot:scaffold189007_cov14-Tisochrysis_lutea.AAC.1
MVDTIRSKKEKLGKSMFSEMGELPNSGIIHTFLRYGQVQDTGCYHDLKDDALHVENAQEASRKVPGK